MMFFNILSIGIEDFAMTSFLFSYFHIESKFKYVLLSLVCMIETWFYNYVYVHNDLLTISLILTYVCFLWFETKQFSFLTLAIPILNISVVVLANCLSLLIAPLFVKESMTLTSMLISRFILIVIFYILIHFMKKEKIHIQKNESYLLILFMLVIFMMLISVVEAMIYDQYRQELIFNLLVELVFIIIICVMIYYNVKKQKETDLQMKEELLKKEYQAKMYNVMEHLFHKITIDKHMMMYTLMKIELLLKMKNYDEAHVFASQELDKLLHYKFISSTGNILFDYEMSELVNILRDKNINVKTVFTLEKENKLLSNENVVQVIVDSIRQLIKSDYTTKKVELFFLEASDKIIFKMIMIHADEINPSVIEQIKEKSFIKKLNIKQEQLYTEFHFLISL